MADDRCPQSLVYAEEGATEVADRRRRIHARLVALQTHYRTQVVSSLRTFPRTSQAITADSLVHTDLIEIALLVFYRHTAFFLDTERPDAQPSSRPDFGLGLAESLRTRGTPSMRIDVTALRAELLKEFRPTADILGNLELVHPIPLHLLVPR